MTLQKDGPFSWLYLAITVIMMLTVQGFQGAIGVVVAIFIEHFDETSARAGWCGSIVIFLIFALCPLVIFTHQRIGFRCCMAIACFFYVLAFLTTPFMPSLNYLYFTFAIPFGINMSIVAQLSITTQRQYFDRFFGFAIGVRFSAIALGALLMSIFLPTIFDTIGFKGTFLSLLAFTPLYLIHGLVSRTHLADTSGQLTHNREYTKKSKIHLEFFQDKSFLCCLAGTTTFFMTYFVPLIFMVRYGVTLGHPISKAKWLLVIRNITTLPARLVVGRVSDIALRRGKVKLIVQITYPIFGLLSFLCSFIRSFPLLMLYMGLNGIVEAVFWVTFHLYTVEITGGYHSEEAYGVMCLFASVASLVGPPALGWLFDETGDFRYVFYTVSAMSLLASFLVTMSSHVTVRKQLSLTEKARNREVVSTCSELPGAISGEAVSRSQIVYETTI